MPTALWGVSTDIYIENQRSLLPKVRSQARILVIERRDHLLHAVHGEVHVGMEPSQLDIYQQNTARRIDYKQKIHDAMTRTSNPTSPVIYILSTGTVDSMYNTL
jgi:hypothetical protein